MACSQTIYGKILLNVNSIIFIEIIYLFKLLILTICNLILEHLIVYCLYTSL